METRLGRSVVCTGLVGLVAVLALLAWAGTATAATPDRTLAQGAGYGSPDGAARVATVQRRLRKLGWRPGPVDGLFGSRTEAATRRFQAAAGLAADGVVGRHTREALAHAVRHPLRRGAGYASVTGSAEVRRLQRRLRSRGLRPGPIDGRFGPRTETAVARAQKAQGLPADGAVDARLKRALSPRTQRPAEADRRPVTTGQAPVDRPPTPSAAADPDSGSLSPWLPAALVALLSGLGAWLFIRRREASQPVPTTPGPVPTTPEPVSTTPEPAPAAPRTSEVRALGYANAKRFNGGEAQLQAQISAIEALCRRRGLTLVEVVTDVDSDEGGHRQPALAHALERIGRGDASCLVVTELERLSRSAADLSRILGELRRTNKRLIAIDLGLDTESLGGGVATSALISVGAWERRRVSDRTRRGLAATRARGAATGRPPLQDVAALKERIVRMRAGGMTLQAIADKLNEDGVPTIRGGMEWRPSSVQAAAGYRRPRPAGPRGRRSLP